MRTIAVQLGRLRRGLEAMGPLDEFSDAAARLAAFEDRLEKRVRVMKVTDSLLSFRG